MASLFHVSQAGGSQVTRMVLGSTAVGTTERGGPEGAGAGHGERASSKMRQVVPAAKLLTSFRSGPQYSSGGRTIAHIIPGTDSDVVLGIPHQILHGQLRHPTPLHLPDPFWDAGAVRDGSVEDTKPLKAIILWGRSPGHTNASEANRGYPCDSGHIRDWKGEEINT